MSKIIQIFLIFFFIENISLEEGFWKLQFLNHFAFYNGAQFLTVRVNICESQIYFFLFYWLFCYNLHHWGHTIEGQELYLHFFHEQVRNAGLVGEHVSLEEDFE